MCVQCERCVNASGVFIVDNCAVNVNLLSSCGDHVDTAILNCTLHIYYVIHLDEMTLERPKIALYASIFLVSYSWVGVSS